MKRLGALKGSGKKGYYNFMPQDPKVHGESAKGMKQPQKVRYVLVNRVPKATGENRKKLLKEYKNINEELKLMEDSSYREEIGWSEVPDRYEYLEDRLIQIGIELVGDKGRLWTVSRKSPAKKMYRWDNGKLRKKKPSVPEPTRDTFEELA